MLYLSSMKTLLTAILALWTLLPDGSESKNMAYVHWIDDTSQEGQYTADTVRSHLSSPLYVLDEGKRYKVHSFELVYKEVGLYENAQGKQEVMADTRIVRCKGGYIDTTWQSALHRNLAWSDTLIFADVRYYKEDELYVAQPLKVYMYMPSKEPRG